MNYLLDRPALLATLIVGGACGFVALFALSAHLIGGWSIAWFVALLWGVLYWVFRNTA